MPTSQELTGIEKEKQVRFEKLAENFTYLIIVTGIVITLLPYPLPVERTNLYITTALISAFAISWFRLIPARFSGRAKNFIYSSLIIFFITIATHFTGGVLSKASLLYYLVIFGVAASLDIAQLVVLVFQASVLMAIESYLGIPGLGKESLSLGVLKIWGLVFTASFAWLVFRSGAAAKAEAEEVRLAKAEAVNEVKNEFVFIISSKLREPLASLQAYLKTAAGFSDKIGGETKELLGKTKENAARLTALVEDLSDLTKIETGKLRLDIRVVDLTGVVGATLSDFTLAAHEKNIKLVYEPSQERISVSADSARLHEILANLTDNAIKYSKEDKEIKVGVATKEKMAIVSIADQGYGIPAEAATHLFEKFYRVDRPNQVQYKGTGLGLFITKQLVERQGGKIWFEARSDGTTFFFSLPIVDEQSS